MVEDVTNGSLPRGDPPVRQLPLLRYPVDSADARDLAELAAEASRDAPARPARRVPPPPEILEEIRRTLAEKRAQRTTHE